MPPIFEIGLAQHLTLNQSRIRWMSLNKPHLEFTRVEMFADLATPVGYPAGISQKLLASDLDETGGESYPTFPLQLVSQPNDGDALFEAIHINCLQI
jgi:hypothetical protein